MGNFLVIRHDLNQDVAVLKMTALLSLRYEFFDVDLLIGKLCRLWSFVDRHTEGGYVVGATRETLDLLVNLDGFTDALVAVGWVEIDLGGARIVQFERYLGVAGVRRMFDEFEKAHPRKRRRKQPAGSWDPSGFEDFWAEYPRHTARKTAIAAWNSLRPSEALKREILTAVRVQSRSEQWTRDKGRFVPYAATWLNGRRWEDEQPKAEAGAGATDPARVRAKPGKYAHLTEQSAEQSKVPAPEASQGTQSTLFAE